MYFNLQNICKYYKISVIILIKINTNLRKIYNKYIELNSGLVAVNKFWY